MQLDDTLTRREVIAELRRLDPQSPLLAHADAYTRSRTAPAADPLAELEVGHEPADVRAAYARLTSAIVRLLER